MSSALVSRSRAVGSLTASGSVSSTPSRTMLMAAAMLVVGPLLVLIQAGAKRWMDEAPLV